MRKRNKKKKPAMILRLVRYYGWHPGRVVTEILEWIEILAVAGLLAFLVISYITVRMSVPTGSMIPTIDPKDSFFVDKVSYYFRDPQPGDVVVFWHTESVVVNQVESESAAGRAGVPAGEQLVAINNEPVFSSQMANSIIESLTPDTPVALSFTNSTYVEVGTKSANVRGLADLGITLRENRVRYVKRLIATGGQTVEIKQGNVFIDGEELTGPRFDRYYYSNDSRIRFGANPTVVPQGKLFVLGDNSKNSWDSRYWGFVDVADFIGEPYLRVWPLGRFSPMNGYFGFDGSS